jgi:phage shock protein PspC (stress-responsive transcriptional regulator)
MSDKVNEVKKIYRSKHDRYLGGVAGGLAEYFNIDANLFRILFILITFTGGIGIILYMIAVFIIPENPLQDEKTRKRLEKDSTFLLAVILILFGLLLLSREFGLFDYFRFWRIPWRVLWALFLIFIGLFMIFAPNRSQKSDNGQKEVNTYFTSLLKQMYRSRNNRMVAGVCGGLAEYFKIDPSIVRLLWVFAAIASAGLGVLIYVILIFVLPEAEEGRNLDQARSE